ncbi:hypothetical protein OC861_006741, partial [Tilletia horrida]
MPEDHLVYIRYVGTFGPSSAATDRFEEDFKRTGGVLAAFLRTLTTELPEVIESALVYTMPSATLTPLTTGLIVAQDLVDERERLLIALFDPPTLLNRQSGGFLAAYEPREEDASLFTMIGTQLLSQKILRLQSAHPSIQEDISILFDDVFEYMQVNPLITGTSRAQPGPGLKTTMLKQATPSTINGHVL